MQEVYDFLHAAETFYLATVDGDQPRVRPFASLMIYKDRLWLFTSNKKQVFRQIRQNPRVELCAAGPYNETWLRVEATAVPADDREVRVKFLEEEPYLKSQYDPDDGRMEVLYLKDATAWFYGYTETSSEEAPRVVKF